VTEAEFDGIYTTFCKSLGEVGEARSPLFLARFALLAMEKIDDPPALLSMIEAAGRFVSHEPKGDR
jgi:hypothetical protein